MTLRPPTVVFNSLPVAAQKRKLPPWRREDDPQRVLCPTSLEKVTKSSPNWWFHADLPWFFQSKKITSKKQKPEKGPS